MAEQANPVLEQVITSAPETNTEEKKPETTVAAEINQESTEVKTEEKPETIQISKSGGEGESKKLESTEENKNFSK